MPHMDSRGSDTKVNKMPPVSQKGHPQVEARDPGIGYLDTLKSILRTSLVVQWVRLHTPNAGGPGSIPGRGTRSHIHATTKSLHAATKKPACRNKDPTCRN